MIAVAVVTGAVLALTAVTLVAYHRGRRRGRIRLPASLVAELREHKLHCMGEAPARVALEIELLCETDPCAARSRPFDDLSEQRGGRAAHRSSRVG